jgi:hypothetical protein
MITQIDRNYIRKRIKKSTGIDLGEVHPEAFVSERGGGVALTHHTNTDYPHTNSAFVKIDSMGEWLGFVNAIPTGHN